LIAGLVLGIVNAVIRPVILLLTLPFTLLTLGLFIFVVNALCLALTAFVVPGFSVRSFWSALAGALIVSLVSWILNAGVKDRRGSRR
jgi:putative membrane protein